MHWRYHSLALCYRYVHPWWPLKINSQHDVNFIVIPRCRQLRQSWHRDNYQFQCAPDCGLSQYSEQEVFAECKSATSCHHLYTQYIPKRHDDPSKSIKTQNCMRPINERRRYTVTPSLIGWEHTQNDPCLPIEDRSFSRQNDSEWCQNTWNR